MISRTSALSFRDHVRRHSIHTRTGTYSSQEPPDVVAATLTRDQVLDALKRDLEAALYAADRAFRQYDAADPANRLVAGELEARWNQALARVSEIDGKVAAQ